MIVSCISQEVSQLLFYNTLCFSMTHQTRKDADCVSTVSVHLRRLLVALIAQTSHNLIQLSFLFALQFSIVICFPQIVLNFCLEMGENLETVERFFTRLRDVSTFSNVLLVNLIDAILIKFFGSFLVNYLILGMFSFWKTFLCHFKDVFIQVFMVLISVCPVVGVLKLIKDLILTNHRKFPFFLTSHQITYLIIGLSHCLPILVHFEELTVSLRRPFLLKPQPYEIYFFIIEEKRKILNIWELTELFDYPNQPFFSHIESYTETMPQYSNFSQFQTLNYIFERLQF